MALDTIKLPLRATNDKDFKLGKREKDCIVYAVLTGCKNATAFGLFFPEYTSGEGMKESDVFKLSDVGEKRCKMFFSNGDNDRYKASYKATLKAFLEGRGTSVSEIGEIGDERKDNALKSLLDKAMKLVEQGGDIDPDTLRTIADVFKRLGVLKDEVETQVRPLRFLPERCFSSCRYRLFVENAVKGGDLVDECQYCRALRYANENGYKDNPTNRLDIPKEVLDAEPENTVSTLDIISGKIEN